MNGFTLASTIAGCALLAVMTPAATSPVTSVDTTGDKVQLKVDNKPFLYNAIQASTHRLEDDSKWSWPSNDFAVLFQTAANDGFSVFAFPLRWNRTETAPDVFDWTILDKAIDHAASSGIKLEILWFGSDICGTWNMVPNFYSFQYILKNSGLPATNAAGRIKFDKCDTNLLARESYVLTQVMNHIADYTAAKGYPTTVVGVQVENEPTTVAYDNYVYTTDRSYSSSANAKWAAGGYTNVNTFNTDVLWEFLNGIAKAVKESKYPVWTRVNFWIDLEPEMDRRCVTVNEAKRATTGTYLDFIGGDPYQNNLSQIYSYCTDTNRYNKGKNFVMVMENSGGYTVTDRLIFNALAGNGVYHIWEINSTILPYQSDAAGAGMYTNANKTLVARGHVPKIRDMLAMVNKDRADLAALRAGGSMLKFYNKDFAATYSAAQTVNGRSITYTSSNTGAGIVAARNEQYVFMSTATGTFKVPGTLKITLLQKGYFNTNDVWVSQGTVSFATSGSEYTFPIGAYECILLDTSGIAPHKYVDCRATGANDGSSWSNAYTDLQQAIANAGSGMDLWVAQGTYHPTAGSDTSATFRATTGTCLYGGFASGMTDLAQRDWMKYPTILSGDIDRNGLLDAGNTRILITAHTNGVFDGFHLTMAYGKNADIKIGTVVNCVSATDFTLRNCLITRNNCGAINGSRGFLINIAANPTLIENCVFTANGSDVTGLSTNYTGLIYLNAADGGLTTFRRNLFFGNDLAYVFYRSASGSHNFSAINCTFLKNRGWQIYTLNRAPTWTARNSIFWDAPLTLASAGAAAQGTVSYCNIQGSGGSGAGWTLGAAYITDGGGNIDTDPLFVGGPTGTWTAAASFDPVAFRTTLTDAAASFGNLSGQFLNPKTTGTSDFNGFLILSNSVTQIAVSGDASAVGGAGNIYEVLDAHLHPKSPCIDAGDPADDYSLEPDPNGKRIDMGAYGGTREATRRPPRGGLLTLL